MTAPAHIRAHRHCSDHREEIRASGLCGCFYCLAIFAPSDILDWLNLNEPDGVGDSGHTALCPKCGIDSVIGSASGYPITTEFLGRMKSHWFEVC